MLKEFKEFAMKGNVVDLAVGVVIGAAFQKIVTSLVEDIIMPCISILIGKIDFSDMVLTVGSASIKYGNFITTIVNFLIISFSEVKYSSEVLIFNLKSFVYVVLKAKLISYLKSLVLYAIIGIKSSP